MTNLGREPLQIVEIDIEYCSLTFGTSPCTAALGGTDQDGNTIVRKCYQTVPTCRDLPNINLGTFTLSFAKNQSGLPKGTLIYPALSSVSTNAARITLGSVDDRLGSLGKRARVTVKLKDFTDSDNGFDKYASERRDGTAQTDEGGYEPKDRGTFFAKLKARFPYYIGRSLRVRNGYVGDTISAMPTRHYQITEWPGPDAAWNISIVAQDPLELTDKSKSLCPKPSQGALAVAISDSFTGTVTLEPATIGDTYATSGRASIGSEIVSFTRSGDDITLTGRGLDGSAASSHSQGDAFQQCYRVEGAALYDVAQELLEGFAGIDPSLITIADWQSEVSEWFAGLKLTRTVTKPTPVITLLGQLADFGFVFWADEVSQEIRLRANRPVNIGETVTPITDDNSLIEGTIGNKDLYEQRISQVQFYHGVIDYTSSATSADNYKNLFVVVDAASEGEQQYNQSRIKTIFSPWLGNEGSPGDASAVAGRLAVRYRDIPVEVTFTADIKDRTPLDVASLIDMNTRLIEDETGNATDTRMQVTSVDEVDSGNRLKVTAQSYRLDGRFGRIVDNSSPDYSSATAAQKAVGCWIATDATTKFPDGAGAYLIF